VLWAAETWHLKGHTLKIKMATAYLDLPSKRILDIDFEFTQPKHVIYIGGYEGNSESRTFLPTKGTQEQIYCHFPEQLRWIVWT
jgi:hypothetical protein